MILSTVSLKKTLDSDAIETERGKFFRVKVISTSIVTLHREKY